MISCVPHLQPVLPPGIFQQVLCLELWAGSPRLLQACVESQHGTVATIRGPNTVPACSCTCCVTLGRSVSDLSELQIPLLWSESVRPNDLRVFFSSKGSKKNNSFLFTSQCVGLTPSLLVLISISIWQIIFSEALLCIRFQVECRHTGWVWFCCWFPVVLTYRTLYMSNKLSCTWQQGTWSISSCCICKIVSPGCCYGP